MIRKPVEFSELIRQFIAVFVESHHVSAAAHEEMMAMSYSDKDVAVFFRRFEMDMVRTIAGLMQQNGITTINLYEKVYISIGLIENLCHEIVYHRHESMNYDTMTEEVVKVIVGMVTH